MRSDELQASLEGDVLVLRAIRTWGLRHVGPIRVQLTEEQRAIIKQMIEEQETEIRRMGMMANNG